MHWQANELPVLPRYTLSISSQIFQALLIIFLLTSRSCATDSVGEVAVVEFSMP
jgi:hypothetical protein